MKYKQTVWTRKEIDSGQFTAAIIYAETKKAARIEARRHKVFCEGDEKPSARNLREMLQSLPETPHADDIGSNSLIRYDQREKEYQIVSNATFETIFNGPYEYIAELIVKL